MGQGKSLRRVVATLVASVSLLAIAAAVPVSPATADSGAVSSGQPGATRSTVSIKPLGLRGGRVKILGKVTIAGTLKPFRPGQKVRVWFFRNGKNFIGRWVRVRKGSGNFGTFKTSVFTREGGRYAAQAKYFGRAGGDPIRADSTVRKAWRVRFTSLSPGQCGRVIRAFRRALNDLALVPSKSRCFDGKMKRAVLAYRKMNNLGRSMKASESVVRKVFNREGRYRVRRPDLGDHMEASLSRQVLVFAKGGRPYAIFPIASGAPVTPTILGTFSVYRKDPGYNSLGMYYSTYFIRGYAIHGYESVPNYPASHGCLRTFIADQPRIYDMTFIGQPIAVYGNARSLPFAGFPGTQAG
jgi:hypothetical protein